MIVACGGRPGVSVPAAACPLGVRAMPLVSLLLCRALTDAHTRTCAHTQYYLRAGGAQAAHNHTRACARGRTHATGANTQTYARARTLEQAMIKSSAVTERP